MSLSKNPPKSRGIYSYEWNSPETVLCVNRIIQRTPRKRSEFAPMIDKSFLPFRVEAWLVNEFDLHNLSAICYSSGEYHATWRHNAPLTDTRAGGPLARGAWRAHWITIEPNVVLACSDISDAIYPEFSTVFCSRTAFTGCAPIMVKLSHVLIVRLAVNRM